LLIIKRAGKTSACLNVAGWPFYNGKKFLVIDLDPQANATSGLGINLKTIFEKNS